MPAVTNNANAGPLTAVDLAAADWSPCNHAPVGGLCTGDCNQGRLCTCAPRPAEACSELGADDYRAGEAAIFWRFYGAGLIVMAVAALAVFWPA